MKNIVVLVSGGGTNLQALIDAEARGEIPNGKITCVIASNAEAYALTRAKQNHIKTRVLVRKEYATIQSYSAAMVEALREENADLVIYAGFMTILDEQDTNAFPFKMMKGFYGLHVHEEALKRGVKLTGATVHFVTEVCDGGPIILQAAVPVLENDTPEILQRRVMEECEWKLLPRAAALFCDGKITVKDGIVHIDC